VDYPKGPWRIELEPYRHIRAADNTCVLARDYSTLDSKRLICNAPEMYEILSKICDESRSSSTLISEARKLLHKIQS
jgi:hypothetical protein